MKSNRIFISQDSNSEDIIATRYLPIIETQSNGDTVFIRNTEENETSLAILKQEINPGECWEYELIKKEKVR